MKIQDQRGFTFAAVLFALVVLLLLTTAGFFGANQEAKVGLSSRQSSTALYVAERGMAEVLGGWNNADFAALPQWGTLAFTDSLPQGYWDVTVTKATDRLYELEAIGTVRGGGIHLPDARRTVNMVTRLSIPDFNARAALTTRNNVAVRGRAEIHGEDTHPPGWLGQCTGPLTDKAGVLIDDSTAVAQSGQGKLTGVPPVAEDTTLTANDFTDFGDLKWAELTSMASKVYAGGSLNQFFSQVDANGFCNRGHLQNWGDPVNPAGPCGNYFPIIYIQGDATLQSGSRGQGMLLVDGNLDVRGDFQFHGIIITQGDFNAQGAGNRVYGSVMASNVDFNVQKGVGASVLDYSSCAIERALLNSSDLTRVRQLGERGWVDASLVPSE